MPAVPRLPTLALPVTFSEPSVPTLVIFGCALVSNVPVRLVATTLVAPRLPTLALPVALRVVENTPVALMLPTLALPVALRVVENTPVALMLPTLALPPTVNTLDAELNVKAALAPNPPAPSLN